MSFQWPVMLWFLLLIPAAAALYLVMEQRRRRIRERFGSLGFAQGSFGRSPGARKHIPPAFFLAGLTVLVISLARPQTVIQLPRIEGTVMLVFDVSGSMAADDMEPSRLEAAKAAAQAFVVRQPETIKIGVVAFSDNGFTVQAPTNEQDTILSTISRLTPQRGTSLGHGIMASLNTLAGDEGVQQLSGGDEPQLPTPTPTPMPEGVYSPAVIVLLTDGENNIEPDPLAAAQAASDRGVRIYTIGIGSAAGTVLNVNGFTVHTRLDEAMLQQIAGLTDGAYYNAVNEQDLQKIYENLRPQLVMKPEKTEVTSVFAGASIIILLISGMFSLLWFNRIP